METENGGSLKGIARGGWFESRACAGYEFPPPEIRESSFFSRLVSCMEAMHARHSPSFCIGGRQRGQAGWRMKGVAASA